MVGLSTEESKRATQLRKYVSDVTDRHSWAEVSLSIMLLSTRFSPNNNNTGQARLVWNRPWKDILMQGKYLKSKETLISMQNMLWYGCKKIVWNNFFTKHHNRTIQFCNIYIFECQWNFGDDGETEFKFNSNSATLVISTAREYFLFRFTCRTFIRTSSLHFFRSLFNNCHPQLYLRTKNLDNHIASSKNRLLNIFLCNISRVTFSLIQFLCVIL